MTNLEIGVTIRTRNPKYRFGNKNPTPQWAILSGGYCLFTFSKNNNNVKICICQ